MTRSRKLSLAPLFTALACLAAPAVAHAGPTVWALGHADALASTPVQGSSEFTATGWTQTFVYDISGSGDTDADVGLPPYLDDDPNCSACTERLKIRFDVPAGGYAAGELKLVYARFGSETDVIRVDGTYVARVAVDEGQLAEFKVSLPALAEGTHNITIKYAGKRGGGGDGHYIDYIKLVEAGGSGGGGTTELWQLGSLDGDVAPSAGSSEFGWTSGSHVEQLVVDADSDDEDDMPIGLSETEANRPSSLDVDFGLGQSYAAGELVFQVARYGSEVDLVTLDNDVLGEFGGAEGEWIVARYVLPAVAANDHTLGLSIIEGLGTNGAHHFDMLRLYSVP